MITLGMERYAKLMDFRQLEHTHDLIMSYQPIEMKTMPSLKCNKEVYYNVLADK